VSYIKKQILDDIDSHLRMQARQVDRDYQTAIRQIKVLGDQCKHLKARRAELHRMIQLLRPKKEGQ
jgi:hypothetical protein